jgi:hypothetical protein
LDENENIKQYMSHNFGPQRKRSQQTFVLYIEKTKKNPKSQHKTTTMLRYLCVILLVALTVVNAQKSRTLTISNCISDVTVLENKAESLNIKVTPPDQSCLSTGQKTCTFDYNTPINSNYPTDCVNTLKGKIDYQNIVAECTLNSSSNEKGVYNFINFPWCYATSCTDSDIEADYTATLYPEFEVKMKETYGLDCNFRTASRSSSTTTTSSAANLSFTNVAVTSTILLLVIAGSF